MCIAFCVLIGVGVFAQNQNSKAASEGWSALQASPGAVRHRLQQGRPVPEPVVPLHAEPSGPASPDFGEAGTLLWPEGRLPGARRGRMEVHGARPQFAFSGRSSQGAVEPPIRILPNSKLEQMEMYAASGTRHQLEFTIVAEVTEYKGENFILIRDVSVHRAAAPKAPVESSAEDRPEAAPSGAEELLAALESEAPVLEPLNVKGESPSSGVRARMGRPKAVRGAESSQLWPEDSRQVDRAGRLLREVEGWTFLFESDSDEPADAPVGLLPNLALQRMEAYSAGGVRSVVFTITGDITEYGGQNYMIVRRFTLRREDGNLK